MPGIDFSEFRSGFVAEAQDLLHAAHPQAVALDRALRAGRDDPRAIRELFRTLHTIKGLASMVDVEPIVVISHSLETVLRQADQGLGRLPVEAVDVLVAALRSIEQRVGAIERDEPVPKAPDDLLDAIAGLVLRESTRSKTEGRLDLDDETRARLTPSERELLATAPADGRRAVAVDFVPSADRSAQGIDINSVRERVGRIAEIVRVLPVARPTTPEVPGGLLFRLLILSDAADAAIAEAAHAEGVRTVSASAPRPSAPVLDEPDDEHEPHVGGLVRVEVEKLDAMMDTLSSLVVLRFRLEREVERMRRAGGEVRELEAILRDQRKQLRDLRSHIIRVRTVPVTDVLDRLPLLVRGAARAAGKRVRLEVDAGRAEVDKAVADRLLPAVVHLVRNAVDHAVESPEEREAQGKPSEGLVRITCFERSNHWLELEVSDDGRGIDPEAVARRAGEPVPTDDAELLELVTRPGLSTLQDATTTSGRGLGMDIVRRIAVKQLGGELRMRTTRGRGTTFTLSVPLSLAILDVFAFTCAEQTFVVPVSMVSEIIEVDPDGVVAAPGAGIGRRLVQRRGAAVPLVSLAELFELGGDEIPQKALVIQHEGRPWGFGVDRLLGQHEVVVRTLDHPLVRVEGVSGAADLGDGRPTLVLDLVSLGRSLVTEAQG